MVVVGAGISSTTATNESSFCCFEKNKIVQYDHTKAYNQMFITPK